MQKGKYYHWSEHRPLGDEDGCTYGEWWDKSDRFPFAVHPKGFLVFLPPSEVEACNEYSNGDPYGIEETAGSPFHKRRTEATLHLLGLALEDGPSDPKLLDIGSGRGYITAEICQNFPEAEISGLDYSISAVSYAVDKFPEIDFIVANAYAPPYCPEYFDAVICNNLWEHVPDPLSLLQSIRTVLKSGGHLILSSPSRFRLENIRRMLRGKPITLMSELHVTEYTVGQIAEQLRYGRFEVARIYSKKLSSKGRMKTVDWICYSIICKILPSHHSLQSTVFFLAKKLP